MRLFDDEHDFLAFEKALAQSLERHPAIRLFAFCVMPTPRKYWHLALRPGRGHDRALPVFMRHLTTTHARRWQKHRHVVGEGHVYGGRYKSFPVADGPHFLTLARYIERNPLRANLVERAEQWRWSSLNLRVRGGKGPLVNELEAALYARLADWPTPRPAPEAWLARIHRPQNRKELAALRRATARGLPFGDPDWIEQTATRLNISLRPRGRPRKKEDE